MHEMMKIMPGWLPFNFKRWAAPLILNMATHRHTTESVGLANSGQEESECSDIYPPLRREVIDLIVSGLSICLFICNSFRESWRIETFVYYVKEIPESRTAKNRSIFTWPSSALAIHLSHIMRSWIWNKRRLLRIVMQSPHQGISFLADYWGLKDVQYSKAQKKWVISHLMLLLSNGCGGLSGKMWHSNL